MRIGGSGIQTIEVAAGRFGKDAVPSVDISGAARRRDAMYYEGASLADEPLCSVVLGTAKLLDDFRLLRRIAGD